MISGTLRRVVEQIAEVTRYPEELLTVNADLENDLGIDSVKNLEIVLALGEEFSLDLAAEGRDPAIRTIGHVANWIDRLLSLREMQRPDSRTFDRYDAPSRASQVDRESTVAPFSSSPRQAESPHFLGDHSPKDFAGHASPGSHKPLAGRIAL
jgi:acyl carrier protein